MEGEESNRIGDELLRENGLERKELHKLV